MAEVFGIEALTRARANEASGNYQHAAYCYKVGGDPVGQRRCEKLHEEAKAKRRGFPSGRFKKGPGSGLPVHDKEDRRARLHAALDAVMDRALCR